MDEFQRPPINLNNDDTQHVFMLDDPTKERPKLRAFIIICAGLFFAMIVTGIALAINDDLPGLIIYPSAAVLLIILIAIGTKASRKKAFTHLVVNEKGITFLRRNGETFFYSLAQFVNLKVTRHYYNGAYTGSSHSLLFKNEKDKQVEISIAGLDKDLISSMFDDIQNMKYNGKFAAPTIQAAVRTVPASSSEIGVTVAEGAPAPATKTEIDPQFPYGVSPVDGKYYTHDADKVLEYTKVKKRTFRLTLLVEALALTLCALCAGLFAKNNEPSILPMILCVVFGFTLIINGAVFLGIGAQNKEASINLIKRIEFYSNCLVVTSTYDKHVFNIPDIMRVIILRPDGQSPKAVRNLKVQTMDSNKTTINLGKITSKKGFEIFGNYPQFYADMKTWCANHGITCVNDVSI